MTDDLRQTKLDADALNREKTRLETKIHDLDAQIETLQSTGRKKQKTFARAERGSVVAEGEGWRDRKARQSAAQDLPLEGGLRSRGDPAQKDPSRATDHKERMRFAERDLVWVDQGQRETNF